ncbi:hypothetical protein LEP1GSC172_1684 [Leptospira noguchii]|uniref:Uncharacterized protein n=1 Tax=Leptospira noguchii TaxID=28182 RepID=M6V8G1_9LEPT|nr:hypothetical protein LEP1GSC172_1684 [Leptospira noguchii]
MENSFSFSYVELTLFTNQTSSCEQMFGFYFALFQNIVSKFLHKTFFDPVFADF